MIEKYYSANKEKLKYITDLKVLFWVYFVVTVVITLQKYSIGRIHNFEIFSQSFYNLIEYGDIYINYPKLWLDYYKYSPSFALLIAPISVLPKYLGVVVWNLLNSLPLYWAIYRLNLDEKKKALVLWIILIELITSVQNCQSNGIYAALYVFTFVMLENRKNFWAALMTIMLIYIKIFGGIAVVLFLMYPERLKSMLYLLFWFVVMAVLPLVIISPEQLIFLYGSWYSLLTRDVSTLYGMSVMGIAKSWFGISLDNTISISIGALLLVLPLLWRKKLNSETFRYMFLCSLLIWTVIFNHKAESPMFVIALTGVALWYVFQVPNTANRFLLWFTLIFTSFSSTDIFPLFVRDNIFKPYLLKVVPCIIVWVVIQRLLISRKMLIDDTEAI